MTGLALELLAMLVYGPLIVLLHEAGHAAFARAGGYRVTSFGIGLGPPLWRVRLSRGVVLHVSRWLIAGGSCVAIPAGAPSTRRLWFHAGGLIAQGLLAVALFAAPDTWLVERVARFNALVAVTNLIPWRFGGAASDGWHLLDALSSGRRTGAVVSLRPQLERLAAREAAIGSAVGQVYAEICLAWRDVQANQPERAAGLFERDPPEAALEPWFDALFHYVKAEWHRASGRPLAALHTLRDTRAALPDNLDETAAALLACAEARSLLELDVPDRATRALGRVSGLGGPIGRQATALHLAALLDGPPDELEFAAWRVVRRTSASWLDPADVAVILWDAADRLTRHQRLHAARAAREASRRLARRVLDAAEPADLAPLTRRLGDAAAAVHAGAHPLEAP